MRCRFLEVTKSKEAGFLEAELGFGKLLGLSL
jgi:hypothetical protein